MKFTEWSRNIYSRTSLIRTPKGQSEASVIERYPYKRGHYDDVTFLTPLTVLSVQELKPRLTLVFKRYLSLLIHSTKTLCLSIAYVQHCAYQLRLTVVRRQNELQCNAAWKKVVT